MLPEFLIEETTVRDSGEGRVYQTEGHPDRHFVLTLGITHAIEQESIEVDIYASDDGRTWSQRPVLSFTPKFYCGTYQMFLPQSPTRYLKPVWRVSRWGRGEDRPFFRFYLCGLSVQASHERAMMAGAA